jgi:hypothetical protein
MEFVKPESRVVLLKERKNSMGVLVKTCVKNKAYCSNDGSDICFQCSVYVGAKHNTSNLFA